MFKNKKKIDSKVRFQRTGFRKQLEQARGYKRSSTIASDSSWDIFFDSLGLTTWPRKLLAALILGLVIYLIYIPNFLTVRAVQIDGLLPNNDNQIHELVDMYLKSDKLWPQSNLLLLSKNNLSKYLVQKGDIIRVQKIEKKFPHSLTINVISRKNQFILETQQKNFSISNDGLVTDATTATTSTSTLTSGLIPIKMADGSNVAIHEQIFNQDLVDKINTLYSRAPSLIKQPFKNFELTNISTPDLALITVPGLKIFFDTNAKAEDSLAKLQLLLSNVADSDLKKLSYIDMRFKERAYICFKNASCDQPTNIPIVNPSASTTTPNL